MRCARQLQQDAITVLRQEVGRLREHRIAAVHTDNALVDVLKVFKDTKATYTHTQARREMHSFVRKGSYLIVTTCALRTVRRWTEACLALLNLSLKDRSNDAELNLTCVFWHLYRPFVHEQRQST
eukprot:5069127-Amphidinium_carterae.1